MDTGIIFVDECNRDKERAVGKTAQRGEIYTILVNQLKAKMVGAHLRKHRASGNLNINYLTNFSLVESGNRFTMPFAYESTDLDGKTRHHLILAVYELFYGTLGSQSSDVSRHAWGANFECGSQVLIYIKLLQKVLSMNFSVKTFSDILGLRNITGIVRIHEHHLMNGLCTHRSFFSGHLSEWTAEDTIGLTNHLKAAGYLVEQQSGIGYKNQQPYIYVWDLNESKDIVRTFFVVNVEDGCYNIDTYSSESNERAEELAKDIIACFKDKIIKSPVPVNYLTGFTSNGEPVVKERKVNDDGRTPIDAVYPYLEGGVEAFVNGYLSPKSPPLLFMLGSAGTGKSTLLRHICREYKAGPIYQAIGDSTICHPSFMSWFAGIPENAMVIVEDADSILGAREEGNQYMSALLNELDGVANKQLKLIVTTNKSSTDKVDPALLRPGRLYNRTKFRRLHPGEAHELVAIMGREMPAIESADYSIAELLAEGEAVSKKTFGFN